MVKVESGLFNRLSGTLQKSRTTFQTRKTGIVAEKKPIPPKDARGRRECVRWIYRYLCDKWNTLSEQEKQQYDETAEKYNITLFNAYLKQELTKRLWKCKLAKLDGQVLYLAMVEGEGNTAKDFSGYGNNGTIYGATWEKDEKKIYLSFDGVNDYVRVQDSQSLRTDKLTVELWLYLRSKDKFMYFVSKAYIPGTELNEGWALLYYVTSDSIIFNIFDGLSSNSASYQNPPTNRWLHIVGTYENGTIKIYANGVLKNTASRPTIKVSTRDVYIGSYFGNMHFFDGLIANVSIYNRALTDEEIARIYELTKKYFE